MNVKVGPHVYSVVLDELQNEEGRCGVTFKQISQIKISPYLSAGMYRDTLLHEVMHAVANAAGINDNEHLTEEEWVSRISTGLLATLRDNPHLVGVLTDA